jgi:hypothetical protein
VCHPLLRGPLIHEGSRSQLASRVGRAPRATTVHPEGVLYRWVLPCGAGAAGPAVDLDAYGVGAFRCAI